MANIFKPFLNSDILVSRNNLYEAIPLTGAIVSGTYSDQNIKNYSHGIWQSVYDYPYASSSANHIFDIAFGYSALSSFSGSANSQNAKKINLYTQMSQILMGYDATGSILEFDEDGDILAGGTKIREAIFINFARLLYKDEIKKGSVTIKFDGGQGYTSSFGELLTITDANAQNEYLVNSPAGEYAILSASSGGAFDGTNGGSCGLIFYQAGIMVLTASIFKGSASGGKLVNDAQFSPAGLTIDQVMTGSTISSSANDLRHRMFDISFNNTTELNTAHYLCRINNSDFNYSSNPTYLSGSKIRVKNSSLDAPVTYITTIGLYDSQNNLLAVAKVSEPIKKDPTTDLTLKVRLDY